MKNQALATLALFGSLLFFCLAIFAISQRYGFFVPQKTTVNSSSLFQSAENNPIYLILPDIGINLPVEPGIIKNTIWPISNRGVSFLSNSGNLGEKGNLIFYGHNWPALLGRLNLSKVGNFVEITSSQNKVFKYKVEYIAAVEPNDISILNQTTDERITLYTCTGFLDSKRLVLVAKRV